jgi:hypothetical protein
MNDTPIRYTLRDLPTAAKLVVSCFLIAVGLGYFSAMVQLHLQHSSKNGEPLPSPADVVEIFAGWKKASPDDLKEPKSKLQRLILGPVDAPFNGSGSMSKAFFHGDKNADTLGERYSKQIKDDPTVKEKLDTERKGEQLALDEWLKLPDPKRQQIYEADSLPLPAALKGKITPAALTADGNGIRVKLILDERCAVCHGPGGDQEGWPLTKWDEIAKYSAVPKSVEVVNGMVRSDRQIGVEKLTQSTHAHLLSFAMLFSLTGFVFAFTSFPGFVRCVLAPIVVIAQVCDVACWWLARIDGVGPMFAQAIILTGTITGLGLLVQIFGSLLNMWTGFRRVLLILILLVGLAGFGVVVMKVIQPALEAEKQAAVNK